MWVKEVILPTQGFFCIQDVISKVYPIINEFALSNKSKTLKEYKEFMKKISIEEFIQKIATKRSLVKYKDACKFFDDTIKTNQPQKSDSLDLVLKQWLSVLNLSSISSPKYKLTLIYFASTHYLFNNSPLSEQNFMDSTWRSEESWENALSIFYGENHFDHVSFNPSIFVELLAIFFGINVKNYENLFESIKFFVETDDNFALLDKYFNHKKLLGDKYFPEKETMFEKSLKYKKFKLAKYLLNNGEGKKLHSDTLIKYFIKSQFSSQNLIDSRDILNELMTLHKQYVLDYQWNHIWNEIFLPVEDNQNPSQQQSSNNAVVLQERFMHVYCTKYGEKKIPQSIWEQAFYYNEQTHEFVFKRKEVQQQISHLVGYYCLLKMGSDTSGTILIEHANRYPGLNYMKDSLMKKFLPNSRLRKEFVKIQDEYYYFSHFNSSMDSLSYVNTFLFWLLFILLIIKQQLSDKGPFQVQESIDREVLSDRLILEMILYPESNPASCFLTETLPNQKLGLIDIGSSEILVQNIGILDGQYQMYVKSVLFCLFEMNSMIPQSTITKYANINSYEVIKEWLLDLSKHQDDLIRISQYRFKQNNIFAEMSTKLTDSYLDYLEREHKPYFGIPIQKEAIKHLLERLVTISKIMKWCLKKSTSMTHQDLFKIIDRDLAGMYEQINNDQITFLEKKYNQITQKCVHQQTFNTQSMASMTMGFSEKRRGDITTMDQLLTSFKQIGPTQALEKIKKFIKIITLEENEQELQKIYNVTNVKQLNFFQRNIQFKFLPSKVLEETLIKQLQEYKVEKPIDYLNLSNSQSLTFKILKSFQLERIQTLILSNTKILDSDLLAIADSYKCLVHLDISNCDDIYYIGSAKPLNYLMSSQITFPSLKTLVANNMKNLWVLDVSGSHIQNISLTNSAKVIQNINVITSIFLTDLLLHQLCTNQENLSDRMQASNEQIFNKIKMISTKKNKLKIIYQFLFQNFLNIKDDLIAMYVLEGINVQVDTVTSEGRFEKGIRVIRGSKGNFMQAYQAAINEIYGLLHFNENVSIKDNIVVISQAFNKRDLQHVFPKNFVTNIIGNLFNSKKANKQINDEFFRFMFKFFVKNPHIKDLDIKSICQDNKPITFLVTFI